MKLSDRNSILVKVAVLVVILVVVGSFRTSGRMNETAYNHEPSTTGASVD